MSPYEIRLLLHFYSNPTMPSDTEFPRGDHYFSTLRNLTRRELLVEHGTRDEMYTISPRGSAYVAALQRVQLPVQTWVMPDSYPHAQHQPEERYYHGSAAVANRDISAPMVGTVLSEGSWTGTITPDNSGTYAGLTRSETPLTGWTQAPSPLGFVASWGPLTPAEITPARQAVLDDMARQEMDVFGDSADTL